MTVRGVTLTVIVVAGIAAAAWWVHRRAAITATLEFTELPEVLVDGEPWVGLAGQCACFRAQLDIDASSTVFLSVDEHVLRGHGRIHLWVVPERAPAPPRVIECHRSFFGLPLDARPVGIEVEDGELVSVPPPGAPPSGDQRAGP